jgi:subtilisin
VRRHGGTLRQVYASALNGFSFSGSEQVARNLERSPRVARVEADQPLHATDHITPTGVQRIAAPAAHASGYTGNGVRIAILDTGIDSDHPALDVAAGLGMNCVDAGSASTEDVHGHGTHVAGTASARVSGSTFVGAATHATVVPVKVLGDTGSGSWESVICGIDHVTKSITTGSPITVANMSLSGPGSAGTSCASSALRQAICTSVSAGVVHVVAAGNDGADAANSIPAAYPEAITVSALDENRCIRFIGGGPSRTECGEGLASFSNRGAAVDVMAPGVGIYSTVVGGGYGTKSGTSMAAPHVAGVAALMRSVNATLSPGQVRNLLQGTGECPSGATNPASSGPCSGQGQWFGDPDGIAEPLINAQRAAAAAGSAPVSDPGPEPGPDPEPQPDPEPEPDPQPDPDPEPAIPLTVTTYKVKGVQHADLAWSGIATTTKVDIFRGDVTVATNAENKGAYTDNIGAKGGATYTYKVCEAGTQTCSASVTATF